MLSTNICGQCYLILFTGKVGHLGEQNSYLPSCVHTPASKEEGNNGVNNKNKDRSDSGYPKVYAKFDQYLRLPKNRVDQRNKTNNKISTRKLRS